MNSLWPAIIAVFGTLAGTGLTLFFASRDKERSFKRDWIRQELEKRAEVYNEILAKLQSVIFAIREVKYAVERGKNSPDWEPEVGRCMKEMRDAMASRTLHCSQEFRDIFNAGVRAGLSIQKKDHGTEASYIAAIEEVLGGTVNSMEKQANKEVSLAAFRKLLVD